MLSHICLFLVFCTFVGHIEALSKDKFSIPRPPADVEVITSSCTEYATVSWTAPTKDFGISGYIVKCTSIDDRVVDFVDSSRTSAKIGPLDLDSEYVCFVASLSSLGGSTLVESEPFVLQ